MSEVKVGADTVLTNHRVVRDGSAWTCMFCRGQWPFPGRVPDDAAPCSPRRWDDDLPDLPQQAAVGPYARNCPTCGAFPGASCRDLRTVNRAAVVPHLARRRIR